MALKEEQKQKLAVAFSKLENAKLIQIRADNIREFHEKQQANQPSEE